MMHLEYDVVAALENQCSKCQIVDRVIIHSTYYALKLHTN